MSDFWEQSFLAAHSSTVAVCMSAAPKSIIACKSPTPKLCLGRLILLGPGNEIVSPMATSLAKRPTITASGKPGRRNHVAVRAQQAPALDVVSAPIMGVLNLRRDDGTWRCKPGIAMHALPATYATSDPTWQHAMVAVLCCKQ